MRICDPTSELIDGGCRVSAAVEWEDAAHSNHTLFFETLDGRSGAGPFPGEAFLAACFPLAIFRGEHRIRIDASICPMFVEGLRTIYAWWQRWWDLPSDMPEIESLGRPTISREREGAAGFLSGGVDSLHMLMDNHRSYLRTDPAYINEVYTIHGFDIGKRKRDLEQDHFQRTLEGLGPVVAETGVRLVPCRTNLRHIPTAPGFWVNRYNGAALAAVAHAGTLAPRYFFLAASNYIRTILPAGTHSSTDGCWSSQQLTLVLAGAYRTRLQKLRELTSWPTAIDNLRVCATNVVGQLNCGACEKCLRTRLEFLAIGVEHTKALGPSRVPIDILEHETRNMNPRLLAHYKALLPALKPTGAEEICGLIEQRLRGTNTPFDPADHKTE